MQPTIASFLQRKTPAKTKIANEKSEAKEPKKRKAYVISSDEDESVPASPQVSNSRVDKKQKSTTNGSTKGESTSPFSGKRPKLDKLKTKSPKKVQPINPMFLFGGETKRVEAKKPKGKALQELEDDEIDQSLMEVDLDASVSDTQKDQAKQKDEEKESKAKTEYNGKEKISPAKSPIKKETKAEVEHNGKEKISPEKSTVKKEKQTPKKQENSPVKEKEHSKPVAKKVSQFIDEDDEEEETPKKGKKKQKQDLDSSVLSDEERHERKRHAAILYQKFKNRSSVLNHGCKEIPKGKPNCLAGLTFLVSGVLESMERDEANQVIKDYGGKTMTTVGKRLNYLVVGEDAGPKKLAQAEDFKVKVISEDDLFDLIREKSGLKTENGNNNSMHDDGEKPSTSPKVKKEKQSADLKEIKKHEFKSSIKKEEIDSPPEKKPKLEEPNNNTKENAAKKDNLKSDKKIEIIQEFPRAKPPTEDMMAWVDRYKPATVKDIIGQQGPASNVVKLTNWLSKWYINHNGTKKLQKPNPWAKNDDGSYYKAALLSGPPGIGKTTSAMLVCKELGFDIVEFNASDTRSKRLLKEEVSQLLSNKTLYGYCHGESQAVSKKHVLIMDEVDGMAGNEDRGGIQELIGLIKESSVPIICMCNDRNHQKMRSLVNYCYDLRFNRPQLKQIKGRILSICAKENIKLDSSKIDEIITATNNDIRQSINHISLLSAGKELNLTGSDATVEGDKIAMKDLKMGPWEVVRKVFSADEHKTMTFYDKCDLFFHDYSLSPLFVQQNYLIVNPTGPRSEVIQKVALTADSLSLGDLVDKRIRSNSAWTLLPTQAVFSSVMPGEYMRGTFTGQINFPGWLGKNSRSTKRCRMAQEIHDHTRVKTSGSRLSIRLDYAPFLVNKIVKPLVERGLEGVEESLETIKEYHLLREDIESLIELSSWPGKRNPMDAVDGKVKAALTRAYNKEVLAYSYSVTAGTKKKRSEAADEMEALGGGEEGEEGVAAVESDEEKDDDDLTNNALVKTKKKAAAASSSKASTTKASANKKPSTSKAKTGSKSKK